MNKGTHSTAVAAPARPESTPDAQPAVGNYFVSAYPPFSTWKASLVGEVHDQLREPAPGRALGLYVHVPFCERKCDYCYYLSHSGRSREQIEKYVASVSDELGLFARQPALRGRRLSFVYFGGGTPSLLTPRRIRALVTGLRRHLPWSGVEEVTFECAPRSVWSTTVTALRDIGATRVSLGIQSFSDAVLQRSGRVHRQADVLRAYGLLEQGGFQCINVDLMTGLPGETRDDWRDSVGRAIDLGADSVTVYQMEVPHNTKTYRDLKSDRLGEPLAAWDVKRERLRYAFEQLESAGYVVVNGYAAVRSPERCRFVYQDELWSGGDMLGLGVASFSYLGGVHFQNRVDIGSYEAAVSNGDLPLGRARRLTAEERVVRELVLRLKRGLVRRDEFEVKFGVDVEKLFARPLRELATRGWIVISGSEVRLTREGLLRVDALLPRFYLREHRDVRYT